MPFVKIGDTVVHVKMAKQPTRYCGALLGPGAGHCGRIAHFLCDHPVGPLERRRCSAPLCEDHAVEVGHDRHYCPRHANGPKQEQLFKDKDG